VTPEATRRVMEREAPGLAEAMRAGCAPGYRYAWLSRAVAGLRGGTLMVNLPGSERGAVESLQAILPLLGHALEVVAGGSVHPKE
jgi:molybdopterin biosynthesis enzyme MoaB